MPNHVFWLKPFLSKVLEWHVCIKLFTWLSYNYGVIVISCIDSAESLFFLLSSECISNVSCSTFPLHAGMLNDMEIKVIFETLTVWYAKSANKVMSPVVFIKLPSTVIVGLREFLLCVTNLYSVPILGYCSWPLL